MFEMCDGMDVPLKKRLSKYEQMNLSKVYTSKRKVREDFNTSFLRKMQDLIDEMSKII